MLMSKTLLNLLALDEIAQRTGSGLHPRLRAAIEADLAFNAVTAGPIAEVDQDDLPENVALFPTSLSKQRKKA